METATVTEPERTVERKAKPGTFKKGNKAAKKRRPKEPVPPPGLVEAAGETQLEAMRCVMSNPEDRTLQQWNMRLWLTADRTGFMEVKSTLERQWMQVEAAERRAANSSGSASGASPTSAPTASSLSSPEAAVSDEGSERVEQVIAELVADWRGS